MDIPKLHKAILKLSHQKIHIDTLWKAKGKGYTSRKLAILCEEATGIPREQWVFPEKFGNPWNEETKIVV